MELELNIANPLAQAILNAKPGDTWLTLEAPSGPRHPSNQPPFRAGLKRYTVQNVDGVGVVRIEFDYPAVFIEKS